jgi:hypothetical protein
MKGFVVCVGIGLVAAAIIAGCDVLPRSNNINTTALAEAVTPGLSFTALAANGQIYYSASVDATSLSLQNVLKALGLPVKVSQDASGTIRIASSTPDGSRFTLVVQDHGLGSTPGSAASQTRVSIEWDKGVDGQRGLQALVQLEAQKKTGLVK